MAIKKKIVTIGGGTGSFVLLSGLKNYGIELSAIVSMADDGGSTGMLRDEMGVLPPGDIRQCLVALSNSSLILRQLFNYRYANGSLVGHSFGNLFLSTLEKITGNFEKAVLEAGKLLNIKGQVIPVTLKQTKLVAKLKNGKIIVGQHNIQTANILGLRQISLRPKVKINPAALKAIRQADKIVICPGNLYSSIIPNLLVDGVSEAIRNAKAKRIYVCNMMTEKNQTESFTVVDFMTKLEQYLGKDIFEYVIYNSAVPARHLMKRYKQEGNELVLPGNLEQFKNTKFIKRNLLEPISLKSRKGDKIIRSYVRHESNKIAKIIYSL